MDIQKKDKIIINSYILLLLGIMIIHKSLNILFIPVLLLYMFEIMRNADKGIGLTIILVLMTPLGLLQSYYKLGFDFSQLFILTYALIICKNKLKEILISSKIRVTYTLNNILIITILLGIILNFILSNNPFNLKFLELRMFLLPIFIIIIFKNNKFINWNYFFNCTIIGISLASFITLFFYFVIDIRTIGLFDSEGRYPWAYQTLYLVTIPLLIHKILLCRSTIKNKLIYFFALVIQLTNIFLGGNRTGFIFIFLIGFFVFLYCVSKLLLRAGNELKISLIIYSCLFIGLIGAIVVNKLSGIEGNLVYRIMEALSEASNSSIKTLDARGATNKYYLNEIFNNASGFGLGKLMYMYTPANEPYGLRSVIDNGFLTFGYKFGLFMLIIICVLIMNSFIKLIVKRRIPLYNIFSVVVLLALIISGGVITGQIFNNNAVSFFFWGLLGITFQTSREI